MSLWLVGLLVVLCGCGNDDAEGPGVESQSSCEPGYNDDGGVCVPEACGTGTWGDLQVDETTVYVDVSAEHGGDGSAETPLWNIQGALDLAGDRGGGLVAVAAGTYAETLELGVDHSGVHLGGRCSDLVVLDASVGNASTAGITLALAYGRAQISGIEITRSNWAGVLLRTGTARLEDLHVSENAYVGIAVDRKGISPAAWTWWAAG